MTNAHQSQTGSSRWAAIVGTGVGLYLVVVAVQLRAQDERKSVAKASTVHQPASDCQSCHTCDRPTSDDPCLPPCTRNAPETVAKQFAHAKGPDIVILDDLQDRYLPVPFDHKGHAEMAAMTSGCAVCHHYTPEGAAHPACKTCHEISSAREDIRKPGLKGAYHRQCMNCHREWGHDTKCGVCHQPKAGRGAETVGSEPPSPGDIVGRMHPPIPEPDTEIYQTRTQSAEGSQVIFRHREHIHRFGLQCVECHHEDGCARCHEAGRQHTQRIRTLADHHRPCAQCHDVDDKSQCDRCHWQDGAPKPTPFSHTQTGWFLNRFHEGKSCRICHTTVPFVKLDHECDACHSGWEPGTFQHEVTGQTLNKTHAAFDCEECHADRAFDQPPSCDECHDEDEGISFPAKRPGEVITHSTKNPR